MKQQTQVPPFYSSRASVGDPLNWDDPTYKPNYFEDGVLLKKPIPGWACDIRIKESTLDARQTYHTPTGELMPLWESSLQKEYNFGKYLNPQGKTGIIGRGVLGWYGPNHAADNIVTREHGAHFQVLLVTTNPVGPSLVAKMSSTIVVSTNATYESPAPPQSCIVTQATSSC
jgi:hypothetical protein